MRTRTVYLSFELFCESRRHVVFWDDVQRAGIDRRRGSGPLKLQKSYDAVDLALVRRVGEGAALGG